MSKPFQLIYSSQPFGYDQATLDGILLDARRCNKRDRITGALVCRQDIYLQLLEGPRHAVDNAYQRIRRDDRHVNVQLQVFEQVPARLFGIGRCCMIPHCLGSGPWKRLRTMCWSGQPPSSSGMSFKSWRKMCNLGRG